MGLLRTKTGGRATEMDIVELQKKVIEYRDARDWAQINQMTDGRWQKTREEREQIHHGKNKGKRGKAQEISGRGIAHVLEAAELMDIRTAQLMSELKKLKPGTMMLRNDIKVELLR
jgi:hypothetical protein